MRVLIVLAAALCAVASHPGAAGTSHLAGRALSNSSTPLDADAEVDGTLEPLEDWQTLQPDEDDVDDHFGVGLMLNQHDRAGVVGSPRTAAVSTDRRGVTQILVGAAQRLLAKRGSFHGSAKITWYAGHDMDNPSCFWATNWTPVSSKSLVVAPTWKRQWKNKPKCGEWVELKRGSKRVTVRVVDERASGSIVRSPLPSRADPAVSTRAFKRLAPLSAGVKTQLKWRRVKGPKSWSTKVYGPHKVSK